MIDAPFDLPGATATGSEDVPDVTIRWSPGTVEIPGQSRDDAERLTARDLQLWLGANGESALVWPGEIGLHYAADGQTLDIVSRPEKLPLLPTLMVGIGIGWLLQRRGQLCLHGTALAWQGRAIGVLGPSGAGKSTLAASLARRGATLLTDDVIVLRADPAGMLVEPGCTSIRMLPDTVAHHGLTDTPLQHVPWIDKQLWQPRSDVPTQAVGLTRLLLLRPVGPNGPAPVLQSLPPSRALPQLISHWYPPQLSRHMSPHHFQQLAEVAQQLPIQEVPYAHTWSHLDRLADLLMSDA